jgi:hypothetical protein
MKNFFNELISLFLILLSTSLFYLAITATYSSLVVNLLLFIIAIFILIKGCDKLDETLGIGKYQSQDNSNTEQKS